MLRRSSCIPARLVIAVALLLIAGASYAQVTTATIEGTVTDGSGAIVANALVTVTNTATNQARIFHTNNAGRYFVNELLPGTYVVSAEAAGFNKTVLAGAVLAVGQNKELNITLSVGQVTQSVEVQASNLLTETETSSTGTVIDNRKITQLPLSNRQFYNLVLLAPGAFQSAQNSSLSYRGGFNVGGATETSNNIIVNGVFDGDLVVGSASFRPSIESIQEFKLLTGTYSAEYGRYSGGQLSIVTKTGTNAIHGSAYEFIRNQITDAKPFFTQLGGVNPAFKQNTFGVTVGGPIIRNKTFFFYAYEGQRIRQQITALATVPTPSMLQGLFPTQLYNPQTGHPLPKNPAGLYDLTTLPQWNSAGAKIGQTIASYFPAPTSPTAVGATPASNYDFSETRKETMNEHSFRVDHTLSSQDSIFGNYNWFDDPSFEPSNSTCGSAVLPNFGCFANQTSQLAVFSWSHIFNAAKINELNFGYDRLRQPRIQQDNYTITFPPLSGVFDDPTIQNNNGLPYTSVSGFSTLGSSTSLPQDRADNHYDITDTFLWVHGRHAIKFGVDLFNYRGDRTVVHSGQGQLTFNSSNLNAVNKNTHLGTTNNSLADLLLGLPYQTGRQPTAPRVHDLYASYHFFAADDWQATHYLTLNYGLRWELDKPLSDAKNQLSNFNLATATFDVAGQGGPQHLWNYDYNNFAPRFGFAWQPYGKETTVVRGAAGVFYNAPLIGNVFGSAEQQPPFAIPQTFTAGAYTSSTTTTGSIALNNPFPTALEGNSITALSVDRNYRTAYAGQWSLGVQQSISNSLLLEITYAGSKGTKLVASLNANDAPPSATPSQKLRAYPEYSTITYVQSRGNSEYNSLQAKVQKRYTNGVSFLVAYTYSKSLDNAPGQGSTSDSSSGTPQDSNNLNAEHGLSDFDVRQRFVFSPVAQLPFGRDRKFLRDGFLSYVVGGWQLSGILTAQSGRPFTVYDAASNTSGSYNDADRPNQIGNPNVQSPSGPKIRTIQQWFNTSAFALQPAGTFGNTKRNNLIGPGFVNLDTSLVRNIPVTESDSFELRVEAFNIFNHPNFYNPRSTAIDFGNSSFGQIQTAYGQRELQGALRFVF
jgi:Carboxypeptidase regulatory-like domain